jgi:hypothetical protein
MTDTFTPGGGNTIEGAPNRSLLISIGDSYRQYRAALENPTQAPPAPLQEPPAAG